MSKYPSPQVDPERPGLGRVAISIVGGLVVLVAVGVAVVQISSRSGESASNSAAESPLEPRSHSVTDSPSSTTEMDELASIAANDSALGSTSSTEVPVLEKTPVPMSYAEAERLYQARDYAGASVGFASYVEMNPDNVWGHYMLGLALWKGKDLEGAEQSLMRGLDRNPDHLKSLVNLARVRLERGRIEQAILPAERAVAQAPESVEVQRVYARVLHSAGRSSEAALAYSRALQIDPSDVWSLNNLGLLWIEQEEFSLALPPLALATQLEPALATAQNNLGIALERAGCFRAATEAYGRALEADSSYAKATDNKARAEALIVTQSSPDPDLAALAASFDPKSNGERTPQVQAVSYSQVAPIPDEKAVDSER